MVVSCDGGIGRRDSAGYQENVEVAELADTLALGASGATHGSSNLPLDTNNASQQVSDELIKKKQNLHFAYTLARFIFHLASL